MAAMGRMRSLPPSLLLLLLLQHTSVRAMATGGVSVQHGVKMHALTASLFPIRSAGTRRGTVVSYQRATAAWRCSTPVATEGGTGPAVQKRSLTFADERAEAVQRMTDKKRKREEEQVGRLNERLSVRNAVEVEKERLVEERSAFRRVRSSFVRRCRDSLETRDSALLASLQLHSLPAGLALCYVSSMLFSQPQSQPTK
eukprot:4886187-Pleurochrysis_carterae.AAC.1